MHARCTRCRTRIKVLIFKNSRGPNINIFFVKIGKEFPFTLKEQTQKYKFEILILKSTILDPRKSAFLVFEENPQQNLFFVFWLLFSFKNNRRTNVLLGGIFENAQKKLLTIKNTFLAVKNFFCAFSKILIKITFVCLLFFNLKQKKNMKKNLFYGFFFKTQKCPFLGVNQFFFFLIFFSFTF